jgi:tyrosinase
MKKKFTRRSFLTTAGAAASVAIFGPSLFSGGTTMAATLMRRDIGGLTATDPIVVGYRTAITAMQALPATDRRSWSYQSAIHGTFASPNKLAWNTCTHHTKFFWSWHRMYLYWFERIVRHYSGVTDWSLPFWNYSAAGQRAIPSMFRDSTITELFVSQRKTSMNNGGLLPAAHVNISTGLAFVPFLDAQGSLESNPHDNVHVDVGGATGWMSDIHTAGQDPIFYLHHANMDRLWNIWLAQGGGRTDPLSDANWKNTKFTFFDENNKQVQMTSCDVLRAAQQLNYTYEGEPTQVKEYCLKLIRFPWVWREIILIRWPGPPIELGPERISIPLEIKELRQRLTAISGNKEQTLQLKLSGVEADRQPGVVWEVYVGLPAGKEPDADGPFFVGTVALFSDGIRKGGDHAGHEYKPASFTFTIDRALREVLRGNDDKLQITMVPSGVLVNGKAETPRAESKVRIGQLTLALQEQTKERK